MMKSVITNRHAAVILFIARILMSLGISIGAGVYLFAQPIFVSAQTTRQTAGTVPQSAKPVEIDIPSIKKSIPLISVGVTKTGNLDVPHNFVQAGWYENGPLPGQTGSVVIDGHVDNGGKSPTIAGVFKRLNSVTKGDLITVKLSDGSAATYKVTASTVYAYNKFPSDTVFNQNNSSYLKIITCHGSWLPLADTYSQRLVVTAELVA